MAKKKQNKNSSKMPAQNPGQVESTGKWLSLIIFGAALLLVFYPPYIQGLFFDRNMFPYHIFTAIVFMLLWVDKIRRKDYTFLHTPLDWAVLAYAGAYLLSLIGAVHPGDAFYGFLRILNYFVIFWIISQVLKKIERTEALLQIILTSGVGVAGAGILAALGYAQIPGAFDGRAIYSTLQYPNTLAAYLAVTVIIGVTLWTRDRRPGLQFIYLLAGAVMSLVVLASMSKGAWLIYGLAALLLVAGMPGISRIKALYGLVFSFIGGLASYIKFYPAVIAKQDGAAVYLLLALLTAVLALALWRGFVYLHHIRGTGVTAVAAVAASLLAAIPLGILGRKSLGEQNLIQELSGLLDLQSDSFVSRLDFNRWGWEMVKDYPVNGTGAGGWNALYHQYQDYLTWTTEAHNHFLQVWIESGTVGFLAFLAVLGISCYCLYQIRKCMNKEDWIPAWGVTTAAAGLLAHSIFDFDMSFGAMAVLLWSLLAVINALYYRCRDSKKTEPIGVNKYGSISLAIIIALTLGITGSSFCSAHNYAQKGTALLVQSTKTDDGSQKVQMLNEARSCFNKATARDSFNGEYLAEAAYLDAVLYHSLDREQRQAAGALFQKAQNEIKTADRLKPNNLQLRQRLLESAALLGDADLTISVLSGTITANPNNIAAYVVLANFLEDRMRSAADNEDKSKAEDYARQLSDLNRRLQQQQERIRPDRPWAGNPLVWPPELEEKMKSAGIFTGTGE
jgi:O-antigen ligase